MKTRQRPSENQEKQKAKYIPQTGHEPRSLQRGSQSLIFGASRQMQ